MSDLLPVEIPRGCSEKFWRVSKRAESKIAREAKQTANLFPFVIDGEKPSFHSWFARATDRAAMFLSLQHALVLIRRDAITPELVSEFYVASKFWRRLVEMSCASKRALGRFSCSLWMPLPPLMSIVVDALSICFSPIAIVTATTFTFCAERSFRMTERSRFSFSHSSDRVAFSHICHSTGVAL